MRDTLTGLLAISALIFGGAAAADDADGPRTGYFSVKMTPVEMVGAEYAETLADTLPPDKPVSWQLYVPPDYSPDDPPGVLVFVSSVRSGGPPRAWNKVLEDRNLIWVGAIGAGKRAYAGDRMLKAIIAPFVLRKDYVVDLSRCYIGGYSNGGRIASLVMARRPEQFKGGIYIGGVEPWEETPAKLDLIRQNRHAFVIGTNDPRLKDMQRVFNSYTDAGVENKEFIRIRNWANRLPTAEYFDKAIDYIDGKTASDGD